MYLIIGKNDTICIYYDQTAVIVRKRFQQIEGTCMAKDAKTTVLRIELWIVGELLIKIGINK